MSKAHYTRSLVSELESSIRRAPSLIHIVAGARQTGKTTAAEQLAARWKGPVVRATADSPVPPGPEWVEVHWNRALERSRESPQKSALLILDEIQKVRGWSEMVKALWDEDRRRRSVRLLLLGSSALLVQKGLTESLAGRFFLHRCPHWSYPECRSAFGWDLNQWIFYGGYPGAARLIRDEPTWRQYIADSLIETAIARDVLALERIAKPALLRHLFGLACQYPAQIISFNKMLNSLQDAGNTVTLAHYLRLLESSFLVSGLEQASGKSRKRGTSPKIVVWNNALVSALSGYTFREARDNPSFWGRLVENAAGAHLLNHLPPPRYVTGYWRERNSEVDYVVTAGNKRIGIEVKSGRLGGMEGLGAFRKRFPAAKIYLIGPKGISLEDYFSADPMTLFNI
ncbi:ATP-binding protein [bacterium]|nr:ATP-binding protein [bacterium]